MREAQQIHTICGKSAATEQGASTADTAGHHETTCRHIWDTANYCAATSCSGTLASHARVHVLSVNMYVFRCFSYVECGYRQQFYTGDGCQRLNRSGRAQPRATLSCASSAQRRTPNLTLTAGQCSNYRFWNRWERSESSLHHYGSCVRYVV